uniref:Thioredoxin domain-containing protein n=1 Tax=Zooxanthella nutricula TaxID=1333877 RepID=A0A7S2K918_9DINO
MVAEGALLPEVEVDGKPGVDGKPIDVRKLFEGQKGILFGVPGAFTPTCSEKHFPSYMEHHADLKAAGAGVVACVSVNDPFVMSAWGRELGAEGKVHMLADTRCELTKALGMELDATQKLGNTRCKRFAMLIDGGIIKKIRMDGEAYAPTMLEDLKT